MKVESTRFTINALIRVRDENKPRQRSRLRGVNKKNWLHPFNAKVNRVQEMDCWEKVERPEEPQLLHTEFDLKRKRIEHGEIMKYKARLMVCGDKEAGENEKKFSLTPDLTIISLVLSSCRIVCTNDIHYREA